MVKMYARRLSPMIEIKCIKGAQGITLYRMIEISFRCEIHGANTCTEIGTPADRLGTMVPWRVGGVYTQQPLSLTEHIIRNQNYSEWQLLSSGETLLWPLAAAQNPKWSKMVPKLTIWNIQAALCPRLSKMAPTLAIWSIWRPWVQYMYRDWRPSESQTCRWQSVRLGNSLYRAESPLHVYG